MNIVEVKKEGWGTSGYQVVYVQGKELKRFSHVSDDFAFTNARECAAKAERMLTKGINPHTGEPYKTKESK